jgi:hypothetical protein
MKRYRRSLVVGVVGVLGIRLAFASVAPEQQAETNKKNSWNCDVPHAQVEYWPADSDQGPVEFKAPAYADLRVLTLISQGDTVKFIFQMGAEIPKGSQGFFWVEIFLGDVFPPKDRQTETKIVGVVSGSYGSAASLDPNQAAIVRGQMSKDSRSYTAKVLAAGKLRVQGSEIEVEFPASLIPTAKLAPLLSLKDKATLQQVGRYLLEVRVYCLPASVPLKKVRWLYPSEILSIPPYSGIAFGGPPHPPLKVHR